MTVFISISGFVTAGMAKRMEERAVIEIYNNYLYMAAIQSTSEKGKEEIDSDILKLYQNAIDTSPGSSEAYIRMLDYYI